MKRDRGHKGRAEILQHRPRRTARRRPVSRTEAPAVAAVDWGTSQLRIWLLDRQGAVLDERRSDDGMLATPKDGFAAVLERHLAALQAPDQLPVIICGMAGARQGWIEAPYVTVPAPLPAVLSQAVAV